MADRQRPVQHARHDLELIAGASAGELTGTDRARAAGVMTSCPECSQLAADLRAIADVTRTLPSAFKGVVATASRDFRLTDQDAARLGRRPVPGFGGVRAGSAWPRRLGAALATLGLVGLLVSAVPLGFFGAAGGASTAELGDAGVSAASLDPQQLAPAPSDLSIKASTGPQRDSVPAEPGGSVAAYGSGALAIAAAGALVAGLGLLLATRAGRRSGP